MLVEWRCRQLEGKQVKAGLATYMFVLTSNGDGVAARMGEGLKGSERQGVFSEDQRGSIIGRN